jgi:predicted oxidoreductase (fatty acid repression mutant protein)
MDITPKQCDKMEKLTEQQVANIYPKIKSDNKTKPKRRVYIYEELYQDILLFAKQNVLRKTSPNWKDNFPYYLEQYVNKQKHKNNN